MQNNQNNVVMLITPLTVKTLSDKDFIALCKKCNSLNARVLDVLCKEKERRCREMIKEAERA